MLSLIGNLGPLETVLILVVIVLAFGGRLPEVAREAFKMMARVRHSIDDLKREVDIDGEIRRLNAEVRRENLGGSSRAQVIDQEPTDETNADDSNDS